MIFGHPDYYPRVGFRRASEFGITTVSGKSFDSFMALPLYHGALDGIHGRYFIDPAYDNIDEKDVLEFEKGFPPKDKFVPVLITVLLCRLKTDARKAIEKLECPYIDAMRDKSEREISMLPGIDKKSVDTVREVMLEHGYRWGEEK